MKKYNTMLIEKDKMRKKIMDSDFSVGFKQGQEHGKEIVLEQVADARTEMEKCIAVFENSDNENGKFIQKGIEIGLSILNKFVRESLK